MARFLNWLFTAFIIASTLAAGLRASAQGIGSHVGAGLVTGEAAGLDDGYVHFGGFVPLCQPSEDSLCFLDGNAQLYENGSEWVGANVGIGVRAYSELIDGLLGANLYYDRRDLGQAEFDQIGLGLESLGSLFDVRINATIPVGVATHDQYVRTGFVRNGIGQVFKRRGAMRTLDSEVGVLLTSRPRLQTRAFVGAYCLFHDKLDDAAGVRSRLETRIADQLFLNGYVENDRVFDTTGGVSLEFRYGRGGSPQEDSRRNPLARLGDPVQRRRHVVVAEGDHAEYFTAGGVPLTVDHFVSSAAGGSGTVDNPYGSLALIATSDADVIYVHGGVYEGQSIALKHSGQQLLAGSIDQTITTDQGSYTIPSSGEVVLRNASGLGILIAADNTSVIGFTIENSGWDGISTTSSPNDLNLLIANNTIANAGRHGIYIDKNATGDIRDNIVTNASQYGVRIAGLDGSIVGNTVTGSGSTGIEFSYYENITGDVRNNIASNSGSRGMRFIGSVLGNFTGNTTDNNAGDGVLLSGTVSGNVSLNNANENGANGIEIRDRVLGDVVGNTTNSNMGFTANGLRINGRVSGNVEDNQSNENSSDGIIISQVGGDLLRNQANNNGFSSRRSDGSGFRTNSVNGSIEGNQFNANARHGISTNAVSGLYSSNITNENGLTGAILGFSQSIVGNVADDNGNHGISGISPVDITGNTATGNGGDGIQAFGTLRGIVSDNALTDNGGQGLGRY